MHNIIKFVLMLMLAIACVTFTTVDVANAYKVYTNTATDLIKTSRDSRSVNVGFPPGRIMAAKVSKQLTGFDGKVVDIAQQRSNGAGVKSYTMGCPGYYTIRIYSDRNGTKQIGYIQLFVSVTDAPSKTCDAAKEPERERPITKEDPDPPIKEPATPPKAPKPVHPHPKTEVKVKETVKPAPKPAPTPPKPEPARPPDPPKPADPPPPAPPSEEELYNAVCKRTAEWTKLQGGDGNDYKPDYEASWAAATGNTLYKYPSNYPSPVVDTSKNFMLNVTKSDGSRYDDSYDYYVLKANSAGDFLCCPIGEGLQNIAVGENGVYTCGTFTDSQVQASYCVASGSTTARYDATTNQCVEDVLEYEYEPAADTEGFPLKVEDYDWEDAGNGVGEIWFGTKTVGSAEEPPTEGEPPATEEPPAEGEGGCDLCKVFECPGFAEIVLPGFKQVGAELIGTVETPPVPDIPRPSMPKLFDVLNSVDERNGNLPTGEDGIKDAGFDADDVKEQAPVIPVRPDTTGGFDIVDPVEALPENYDDAPVPEGEEIPIPTGDYSDAPAPDDEYDATATPPSYGSDDDTATPPGEYDATATPPDYNGTATPPAYDGTAIPPYTP